MKKIISMLTASAMFSVILTGCGIQPETGSEEPEIIPDIQIATIQIETQAETVPETVQPPVQSTETVPHSSDTNTSHKPEKASSYATEIFDKAVYSALLSGLTDYPSDFIVTDADDDGMLEFLVAMPISDSSSQNFVFESVGTASGLYYYDATGIKNDFYVIEPETNKVYLNENTRTEDGAAVISQEYFRWDGRSWKSTCMLYSNNCYWDNQNVTTGEFQSHAAAMQNIYLEDIFNISAAGTPSTAAEAFYQYLLSKGFAPQKPLSADMNGDGALEYYVAVQDIAKPWYSHMKNLYNHDETLETLNFYTACFIFDKTENNTMRIRSENFDRRYRFSQSGQKIFAYDDTETIQTVQYSGEPDGFGVHIMSVSMMMG